MQMSKSFFVVSGGFLICLSLFFSVSTNKCVSSLFSLPPSMASTPLESVFHMDKIFMLFFLMVTLVTSLVFLFAEFYMGNYNNKKFLVITLFFFSAMIILSGSGDLLMFMLGWDGLGISSLFLIMFYPNKISFSNSMLTFFFNRLGDIFLILFFCLVFYNFPLFFYMSNYLSKELVYFVLGLCLLTKSAQLPLSSWLPAAMSAPTPISAMVHSSTLVTAGILIFFKTSMYLDNSIFHLLLLVISCSTFLLGGLMGCIEKDLKKIVAFSTMSQISMILFFIGVNHVQLAVSHTFCHALFKTLLFCSCGILFTWNYSDQASKIVKFLKNLTILNFLLVISVFSMSGLIFSSSFFTKDMVFESIMESKEFYTIFILVTGSALTLIYSVKILNSMNSCNKLFNVSLILKHHNFWWIMFFSICTISLLKLIKEITLNNFSCLLSWNTILLLNLILFFFLTFKFNPTLKWVIYSSSSVFFMKETMFSFWNLTLNSKFMSLLSSDQYFFKPSSLLEYKLLQLNSLSVKVLNYALILLVLMIF